MKINGFTKLVCCVAIAATLSGCTITIATPGSAEKTEATVTTTTIGTTTMPATTATTAAPTTKTTKKSTTKKKTTTTKASHAHTYSKQIVAATCTEKGYTKYSCACGDNYTADYTSPAHNYEKCVCTKCGEIDKSRAYDYLIEWVKKNGE